MSLLSIRGLGKTFGSLTVVEDLSLDVEGGEFVCLVGPSGCGKSTMLNCIAGLDPPTTGEVYLQGRRVTEPSIACGVVFQDYALFPWMTVQQNVEFGLRMKGLHPESARRERIDRYLDLVGLRPFARYFPHQLSGGMRQRVALARSLVVEPTVLLMDEPFAALDALTRRVLQEELVRLWLLTRMTIVFITHSLTEAVLLADRVVCLTRRPTRVKAEYAVGVPRPRAIEAPTPDLARVLGHVQAALYAEVEELRGLPASERG